MDFITILDVSLGILALYLLKLLISPTKSISRLPLPPGPKPLPLIGNLLDLPKEYDWLHWAKHKPLYGPMSSVSVFGKTMILIHSSTIAFDLFEKRSSFYSSRPTLVFGGQMCGWENSLPLLTYGSPRFRAYRKNLSQIIGTKSAISKFSLLEEEETRTFLKRVMDNPGGLLGHIRKLTGAVILKISHGYTVEAKGNDPLVDLADDAVEHFSLSTTPGVWLVDVMPFLRYIPDWLPGAGFKRTASRSFKKANELADKPYAFVKRQMASGIATPSYTSALLEKLEKVKIINNNADAATIAEEEFIIKWSATTLYGGGADTTVSAIYGFYLAMVLFPDIQARAQAEIDSVIGSSSGDGPDWIPGLKDRENLVYVNAVAKEVLRWNPIVPMGLPHVNTEDDVYNGYFIPKGSILMANIWQMTHDPSVYRDPFEFKPERYLGESPEPDSHLFTFGFGRRICPGKELADTSLFLAICQTLAVFTITKPISPRTGEPYTPECHYQTGVISHPKTYECRIMPRSEKLRKLIEDVDEEFVRVGESDANILKEL
ncbi:cytochrome P450 oxidoreductase OrdA-like protein [Rickenella mellea]|uniref:Cytochrome P450 oxidoreductase OrdA-like protein n=1 Tax=Rickenella mellea TaxID=50990 RepID=A0A4Y7PYV9_9AGAM|nr:cytochrome P450 oxidoreductase OrdA-like protein [Rickenella mellea]